MTAPDVVLPLQPMVDYFPRLLTVADLAELPSDLPSGAIRYELDDGVLLTLPPLDAAHGIVAASISYALGVAARRLKCVACSGGVGVILRRSPDRVVGADILFIAPSRLPVRQSDEGYLETMPDLVVEVVSMKDTRLYLERKINDCLLAGVAIVWLVDPAKRTLVEHRPGQEPRTFDATATVELPDLIPGFQLRLADVFAPV